MLYGPVLSLRESALLADKKLSSLLVVLQHPLEPSEGYHGELATMRLPIGTPMAYGEIGSKGGYVLDAMEIVHPILVSDVFLASEDIDDGAMQIVELLLLGHGHTAYSLVGILLFEESAVANHDGFDARVGTVEEGLQSATRHTGHADVADIEFLVIGRLRIGILSNGPVEAFNLLLSA